MAPKPPNANLYRSSRKANAAGFAKRQLRKTRATADVYEYSSGKNKRSAITLSLDRDEEYGPDPAGHGSDGGMDGKLDRDALRARIMNTGEDGDDVINSEDDEEIESDNAFEESDEDRFAGFSFAKKTSRKAKSPPSASTTNVRFAEVDLDEHEPERQSGEDSDVDAESEELDGNSDEFLDVLDVLDGRGEPVFDDETEGHRDEKDAQSESAEESEDGEGIEEEVEEEGVAEDDEEALENLGAFVSKLEPGKKRKAEDDAGEAAVSDHKVPGRKRRMLKERTEAGVETEFGVHAAAGSKLQLDDLLAPLASSASLQALRKSTKILTKGDALAVPLPQRTQDRLDREAAYEQTKGEVDKWKATMKRIKEADHLSFPLQVPQKVHPSSSQLTANFKPSTELESTVDKLLRAAQMRDEGDITKTEELKMNHLSVEEVAARRAELRKMRELMFRADAKAKRVAKIKSKTYRKIQRKGREKIKGLIKEAEGLDGVEDGEDERMKREVERAKERATLRHKNTGKWAKAMKGRGELDVDQRREIEEMLERGEALRAKIQGDNGSDDDDDDTDGGVEDIKASAFEELRTLERDDDANPIKEKGRGVFGMKFMQDAMARDAQRVAEAADDVRDTIARLGGSGEDEGGGEDVATDAGDIQIQRVGGRLSFRPGQKAVKLWPVAPSDSSSTLKSSEPALLSPAVASVQTIRSSPPVQPDGSERVYPPPSPSAEPRTATVDVNPWLQPHTSATQSRRKNEIVIGKDSAGADKSKNQMKKRLKKGVEEREKARDDAVVEISMDDVLGLPSKPSTRDAESQAPKVKSAKATGKAKAMPNGKQVDTAFEDSDADSEIEAQEQQMKAKGKGKGQGVKAFEQRDLVALAFAGDNVVHDFEALKKREVEADAPREEDHTLPGWGSWGGAGVRPNPKAKKFIKKVAGIDPKSRADHGKPHVIISEKKDKKAAKYLTKDLPYPYTSKAQFEKSMEIPVGTEWNTRVGFQRQTLPRVVKKMGTVIDPLEKLF